MDFLRKSKDFVKKSSDFLKDGLEFRNKIYFFSFRGKVGPVKSNPEGGGGEGREILPKSNL